MQVLLDCFYCSYMTIQMTWNRSALIKYCYNHIMTVLGTEASEQIEPSLLHIKRALLVTLCWVGMQVLSDICILFLCDYINDIKHPHSGWIFPYPHIICKMCISYPILERSTYQAQIVWCRTYFLGHTPSSMHVSLVIYVSHNPMWPYQWYESILKLPNGVVFTLRLLYSMLKTHIIKPRFVLGVKHVLWVTSQLVCMWEVIDLFLQTLCGHTNDIKQLRICIGEYFWVWFLRLLLSTGRLHG